MMTDRIPTISAQGFHKRMSAAHPVTLLDVRSPAEYRAGHVRGAFSLPLDELDTADLTQRIGVRGIFSEVTLYLTCQSGVRAQQARRSSTTPATVT